MGKGSKIDKIIAGVIILLSVLVVAYLYESIQQQTSEPPAPAQTKDTSCDPLYPDGCIPIWPPDLDCDEIQYENFKVLQPDPHGFDPDKDGIGCES